MNWLCAKQPVVLSQQKSAHSVSIHFSDNASRLNLLEKSGTRTALYYHLLSFINRVSDLFC